MTHLDHPTQTAACGTRSTAHAVPADAFRVSVDKCKRCAKTLAALDAGRPAYRGIESAALAGR